MPSGLRSPPVDCRLGSAVCRRQLPVVNFTVFIGGGGGGGVIAQENLLTVEKPSTP
jgi:hypothetical protein